MAEITLTPAFQNELLKTLRNIAAAGTTTQTRVAIRLLSASNVILARYTVTGFEEPEDGMIVSLPLAPTRALVAGTVTKFEVWGLISSVYTKLFEGSAGLRSDPEAVFKLDNPTLVVDQILSADLFRFSVGTRFSDG